MTDQPAHPTPTKVDITVAGHTVIEESPDSLDTVAAKALELFRQTEGAARRSSVGFGTTAGTVEHADPDYDESTVVA